MRSWNASASSAFGLGSTHRWWPAVDHFVSPDADPSRREQVAERLDDGQRTDRAYMGSSTCRICGSRNGSGELTNGVFIWPEALTHYVREHQVVLPNEVEEVLLSSMSGDLAGAVEAANEERDIEWWQSLTSS